MKKDNREVKEKITHTIKVKGGRAYLHIDGVYDSGHLKGVGWSMCEPLGNNARFIKAIRDKFNAEVIFLD